VRKNKNYEPRTPSLRLSWVSSHPKNPKTRFVDGALVGVGSLKPRKKREIYKAQFFFPV